MMTQKVMIILLINFMKYIKKNKYKTNYINER